MKLTIKLILLLSMLSTSGLVMAGNNYFWLMRIMPNLRALVQGLVRVPIPTGATNAALEMQYYRLGPNSLTASSGTGPNPQVQSGWNIHNLMSLNWRSLPQRRISSSGEVRDNSYYSSVVSTQNYLPELTGYLARVSPIRAFYGISSSSFGLSIPFFDIPVNVQVTADNTAHSGGIDITPEGEHTGTELLIAPMTPIQPSIAAPFQGSELASALNAALTGQDLSETSFDPLVSNLLSTLSDGDSHSHNMFFIPSLNSYLSISQETGSVLSLVPHETLIRLGLIPDADRESMTHLDPDSWGQKK